MSFPTHIVSAGGIVEDSEGNILLVKTRDGGWVYPGGQVEVGENLIDALVREIKEESGITTTVSYLVGVYSNTGSFKWYDGVTDVPTQVIFDFVCKPVGGQLAVSEETTESRWVAKDQALSFITHPAIRTRYQAYLEFDGMVNYMEYVTHPQFTIKHQTSMSK
ncbi:NUDIX hydrolase [Mesobacillus selenatarsenatis]|uniref:Nudix hydrolase family protein n=1 Tax=Mesobacillus selenatarsenatis (strain DSM 18680 / JCM 14380 / FERM P-15431 / SF-1) TaxID=1321606 RepID=A0A0A8X062_MESS1|nr:NUDIX domain-containing protein [Mesobacillus selenatarsenatis]GAM12382.1 nudix hydrolase family protein [Mesobacillus selenatarsenatis SF-1]